MERKERKQINPIKNPERKYTAPQCNNRNTLFFQISLHIK